LYIGSFRESDYPCLCLCFGLEQITIIRPRLRINRHFSQILRTEALIFIFIIPYLNSNDFLEEKKFLEIFHLESYFHERDVEVEKLPNLSNPCYGVDILYVL
jgi:hypothetical protein